MSGIVQCFLCQASIFYDKNDQCTLLSHMSSEHNAFFGTDFLLAGCIMNKEERMAMVNVVKDRQPRFVEPGDFLRNDDVSIETDDSKDEDEDNELYVTALTPETTLQEIDTVEVNIDEEHGVSPPRIRTDSKPTIKFPCPECPLTFNLKIRLNKHIKLHVKKDKVVEEIYESKKEIKKEKKAKTSLTMLKQEQVKQGPRAWAPKEGASGTPCTECGKFFKSRANMQRHFEDMHQAGEFPCKGCGKVFSSKNKMGSHYSRHCNPSNPNAPGRRKTTI